MTLTKLVNGERVDLTQDEINAHNQRAQAHTAQLPARFAERYHHLIKASLIEKATEMGYDGEHGILSFLSSGIAEYKADADKFLAWRDQVWLYADAIINDVRAGSREPVDINVFRNNIPVME